MRQNEDSDSSDARRTGRREVALPEHFCKRLAAYAATAGAAGAGVLGLAQPAQADIIVNNNPISIGIDSTVPLQINGVTVLSFVNSFRSFIGNRLGFLAVDGSAAGHVLGFTQIRTAKGYPITSHFASRLAKGAVIGSGGHFIAGGSMAAGIQATSISGRSSIRGQWPNQSGYIGFEFLSSGQTHFGWALAKVSIKEFMVTGTVSEFAYDTVPNQGLLAGQTSGTPEPGTLGLLAIGSLGLGLWRRRKAEGSQQ